MVLYSCDVCNFKSQYLTRYREHCQTRKHLRNLEKHELNNIKVCDPQLTLFDPQKKVTDPQMTLNDPQNFLINSQVTLTNPKLNVDNFSTKQGDKKKYICEYCGKKLSKNCHLHRHLKICKVKQNAELEKEENDKLTILENKFLLLESKLPIDTENNKNITHINISNTTNNNNTNNIINNTINNLKSFMSIPSSLKNIDKTIKFLNDEYPDVLDFPSFIIKVRDECVLSVQYREILIVTFKASPFLSFTKIFNCVLTKMCVDIGIVPFCCSDSNLRNHKEKHEIGWCNMIETTNLHILIDVVLEKVNQDETHICLLEKQYVQLCNKLKKFFSVNRMRDTSSLPASMDYHKLLVGIEQKDS